MATALTIREIFPQSVGHGIDAIHRGKVARSLTGHPLEEIARLFLRLVVGEAQPVRDIICRTDRLIASLAAVGAIFGNPSPWPAAIA